MLKQTLIQKQQQVLTAQQIQQIKMLELPTIELEERIIKELEENPALEEDFDKHDSQEEDDRDDGNDDMIIHEDLSDYSIGDYRDEDEIPEYKLRLLQEKLSPREDIPFAAGAPSLNEQLMEQLELTLLTPREALLAPYVIGNIDADGYLSRSVEEIEDDLLFRAGIEASPVEIQGIIDKVQKLDPAGVCARNLQECLLLQLERKPRNELSLLAQQILKDNYLDFANKRYDKIITGCNINESDLAEVIKLIMTLTPKPGNGLGDEGEAAMSRVHPDFIVEEQEGELIISLADEKDLPPLRISNTYTAMLNDIHREKVKRTREDRKAITFIKKKVDQAKWFIDAIRQRQNTLQSTMRAIVRRQESFFRTGEISDLKPMILKDVAEDTGFDISTISRVSNSKYVQTDFGIYPLKYFFSEGIASESGEEVSTREVKHALQEIVACEDGHSPFSDAVLVEKLAERGYPLARRTVAKYRDELGIPIARLRKTL
ncbi:RNA polymerase factor sigma-54 [Porphyromonas pogonae]|uniref:RNA polymerase factor sigma-54 n=1 Tax=Porphyromonas pogonae TaxID=867595 RepID=UPI002E7A7626|nr:RNA polymerase factor sigma-54 [Porphyromonas pogonae]